MPNLSAYGSHVSRQVLNRDRKHDCVYFIQDLVGGEIKIGWCASVRRRLSELSPGNPHPLGILATMRGGQPEERQIHLRFKHLRIHGEWFRPGDDLVDFILKEATLWK